MASVLLMAMMSKPSGLSGWQVMVLVRGEMKTRTRDRASWPPTPTRRDVGHEALEAPPGHDGMRGERARSASTACPRRHALPLWMAVLALVRVADTPAEGKAY
jgi:hypothetical protein